MRVNPLMLGRPASHNGPLDFSSAPPSLEIGDAILFEVVHVDPLHLACQLIVNRHVSLCLPDRLRGETLDNKRKTALMREEFVHVAF